MDHSKGVEEALNNTNNKTEYMNYKEVSLILLIKCGLNDKKFTELYSAVKSITVLSRIKTILYFFISLEHARCEKDFGIAKELQNYVYEFSDSTAEYVTWQNFMLTLTFGASCNQLNVLSGTCCEKKLRAMDVYADNVNEIVQKAINKYLPDISEVLVNKLFSNNDNMVFAYQAKLLHQRSEIWCLEISPCGKYIFSLAKDGTFCIISAVTYEAIFYHRDSNQRRILAECTVSTMTSDSNNITLAFGSSSGQVYIVQVKIQVGTDITFECQEIARHHDQISSLFFVNFESFNKQFCMLVSSSFAGFLSCTAILGFDDKENLEELCHLQFSSSIYSAVNLVNCTYCLRKLSEQKLYFLLATGDETSRVNLAFFSIKKSKAVEDSYVYILKVSSKLPDHSALNLVFHGKKKKRKKPLEILNLTSMNTIITAIKFTGCLCRSSSMFHCCIFDDGLYQFNSSGQLVKKFLSDAAKYTMLPFELLWSKDAAINLKNAMLLSGSHNGTLNFFDADSHNERANYIKTEKPLPSFILEDSLVTHSSTINCIALRNDKHSSKTILVTGSDDCTINLYELKSKEEAQLLPNTKSLAKQLELHARSIVSDEKREVYTYDCESLPRPLSSVDSNYESEEPIVLRLRRGFRNAENQAESQSSHYEEVANDETRSLS